MRSCLLVMTLVVCGSVSHSFVHRKNMVHTRHPSKVSVPNVEVTLQEVPQEVLEETQYPQNSVKPESGFQDFLQFGQEQIAQPHKESTRISRPVRSEVKARNSEPARNNGPALRQTSQKRSTAPAFRGQFYSPQVPLNIDPGLISRWNLNQ